MVNATERVFHSKASLNFVKTRDCKVFWLCKILWLSKMHSSLSNRLVLQNLKHRIIVFVHMMHCLKEMFSNLMIFQIENQFYCANMST